MENLRRTVLFINRETGHTREPIEVSTFLAVACGRRETVGSANGALIPHIAFRTLWRTFLADSRLGADVLSGIASLAIEDQQTGGVIRILHQDSAEGSNVKSVGGDLFDSARFAHHIGSALEAVLGNDA